MLNFLSNALKFTDPQDLITISCSLVESDEDHDYAEINQINWYQSSNDSGYFEYESLVRQFQADVRQELLKPQVGMPVSQIKGDSPLIANEFFEWLSSQYFNEQATSEKAEEKFDSKAVKPSAQFRKNTWVESKHR